MSSTGLVRILRGLAPAVVLAAVPAHADRAPAGETGGAAPAVVVASVVPEPAAATPSPAAVAAAATVDSLSPEQLLAGLDLQAAFSAQVRAALAPVVIAGPISWYGPGFAGRLTANGERFDPAAKTMAHRELPFGTRVRVTNPDNGRSVVLRVNDRGPFIEPRIADVSYGAAKALGFVRAGVVHAELEVLDAVGDALAAVGAVGTRVGAAVGSAVGAVGAAVGNAVVGGSANAAAPAPAAAPAAAPAPGASGG